MFHLISRYFGHLQFKHVVHPQLKDLVVALRNNETNKVKMILQEFSLLSIDEYDSRMSKITKSADITEYIQNYWIYFGSINSPSIMYEIIAAGFPVMELALTLHYAGNKYGFNLLCELLPSLTEDEVVKLDAMVDLELDICAFSYSIPRIPLRLDGVSFCLTQMIDAVNKTNHNINMGYSNGNIYQNQEKIILDLAYLSSAKAKLVLDKDSDVAISRSHATLEKELLSTQKQQLAELELALQTSKDLADIACSAYTVAQHVIFKAMFLMYAEIVGLNSLMWLSIKLTAALKLQDEDMKPFNRFNDSISMPVVVVTALCLLAQGWIEIGKYLIWNHNKSRNLSRYIPGFTWLYHDEIEIGSALQEIKGKYVAASNQMISGEAESFDYKSARRTLPKKIAQRFSKEYREGASPALLFWSQAFNSNEHETDEGDIKYNNTPAYRIL